MDKGVNQVVDEAVLTGLARMKTDPDFVPELTRGAIGLCEKFVERIGEAVGLQDVDAVKTTAHALYGCAGSVGFVGITRVCDQFRGLESTQLPERGADFESRLRHALSAIKHYLEARKP